VRGTARVNTSGGSIEIDAVTGEIHAETSGGRVDIRGAGDRVEAHSSGGPVTVGFAAGNNRGGVLSTSGGGVRVEIDPKVSLTLDASTSGGGVISDVPVTTIGTISRGSLRGDIKWRRFAASPAIEWRRNSDLSSLEISSVSLTSS
jgi:hypothetical protein